MITICDTNPVGGTPVEVYGEKLFSHQSYHYQVVETREVNGHDDSDFYAIVPDGMGGFTKVFYATTRAWTYGNSASVDAPPSLVYEYKAWKVRQDIRHAMFVETRKYQQFKEDCAYWLGKVSEEKLFNLWESNEDWQEILKQLGHAKRSSFRLSLRDQVTSWLLDENPKYDYPLSDNQRLSILRWS